MARLAGQQTSNVNFKVLKKITNLYFCITEKEQMRKYVRFANNTVKNLIAPIVCNTKGLSVQFHASFQNRKH